MEAVENSPSDHRKVTEPIRAQRSKITNGKLLLGIDQRSPWVRRAKDIIRAHLSDLGGEDNTSAAERSIVRRCAVLTTELERLEAKFATAGEASECDLDLYQRMTNTLRRALEAIGLQRRARPVETLSDYMARNYPKRELAP